MFLFVLSFIKIQTIDKAKNDNLFSLNELCRSMLLQGEDIFIVPDF